MMRQSIRECHNCHQNALQFIHGLCYQCRNSVLQRVSTKQTFDSYPSENDNLRCSFGMLKSSTVSSAQEPKTIQQQFHANSKMNPTPKITVCSSVQSFAGEQVEGESVDHELYHLSQTQQHKRQKYQDAFKRNQPTPSWKQSRLEEASQTNRPYTTHIMQQSSNPQIIVIHSRLKKKPSPHRPATNYHPFTNPYYRPRLSSPPRQHVRNHITSTKSRSRSRISQSHIRANRIVSLQRRNLHNQSSISPYRRNAHLLFQPAYRTNNMLSLYKRTSSPFRRRIK